MINLILLPNGIIMSTNVLNESVLVLNSTYEAINICNVKRAILLIFSGIAVVQENNGNKVHSPSLTMDVPSVIRLTRFINLVNKKVVLNRKNVLLRDKYTCQYCAKVFHPSELTIDHIIPRANGGKSRWENVVASCKICNNKKGQKTVWKAKMSLVNKPSSPNYIYFLHIMRHFATKNNLWMKYLFN
jgi:5-methylcytosine-specific restriction endonuclease McrA